MDFFKFGGKVRGERFEFRQSGVFVILLPERATMSQWYKKSDLKRWDNSQGRWLFVFILYRVMNIQRTVSTDEDRFLLCLKVCVYDLRTQSKESKLVDYLSEQDTEKMLMQEKVLLQTYAQHTIHKLIPKL